MRYQILLFITILSLPFIFAGCGGSQPATNTTINNNAANTPANNSNASIPPPKKTETETTNNAPTLAPVVTAYYEAWKKKDDAALKKVFSQSTLKSFEEGMKADKKTSLAEWLSSTDTMPDKPFEVRNEKIEGDTGVAEIKGGSYGVWTAFKFVRENGEWKMTNETADFDAVKKSATESNTAK